MNKRVVIFSTTYFPLVGGAEVALKEITDRLPDWEFNLVCAKLRRGLPRKEKIGNVTVLRVGFGLSIDKYLLPVFGLFRTMFFRRPAVVWSLMASYGGFAALAYTWFHRKSKLLLTLQEGDPLEHYAKRVGKLGVFHSAIFKRAHAVQAISVFLGGWAEKMGFAGKAHIVPNGVDIEKFANRITFEERQSLRRGFGFSDSDVVIVTASRLSLKNAVDDMIRALAFLPEHYKLLIAGVGEDEDLLRNLVREFHAESRVTFVGRKTHDELPALLQASDIFCRPSLSEGLGNSFLEAMAAGIPIIGTPVGGIPDFLTDGETGVFCNPRDPESLAKAAIRIQSEPGLRERLIRNGEARVRNGYDWDDIAQKIDTLLQSLSV